MPAHATSGLAGHIRVSIQHALESLNAISVSGTLSIGRLIQCKPVTSLRA